MIWRSRRIVRHPVWCLVPPVPPPPPPAFGPTPPLEPARRLPLYRRGQLALAAVLAVVVALALPAVLEPEPTPVSLIVAHDATVLSAAVPAQIEPLDPAALEKLATPTTVALAAVPSTTTTTAAPHHQQEGRASWYRHRPGICAHRNLAFGTVVRVTNLDSGLSTTCEVGDRGPYIQGRIIDLDRSDFDRIASPGTGVIPVRIEW